MAYKPTINTKWYWKLDGNSLDSSGLGNNGTDTAISYVAGREWQAASFNGSSSKITAKHWLWTGNITFTVSLFFYVTWTQTRWELFSIGNHSVLYNWILFSVRAKSWGNNAIFFDYSNSVWGSTNARVVYNSRNHLLVTKSWDNIIVTLNGVSESFTKSSLNVSTDKLLFGDYWGGVAFLNWLIDEVIIEDRAWSATEVRNYYSSFFTANAVWRTRYRDEIGQVDSVGAFA